MFLSASALCDPLIFFPWFGSSLVFDQAAFFGQMGAVRELLESIANPNAQDAEGCTPVFLASQEGHEEVSYCRKLRKIPQPVGRNELTPR